MMAVYNKYFIVTVQKPQTTFDINRKRKRKIKSTTLD